MRRIAGRTIAGMALIGGLVVGACGGQTTTPSEPVAVATPEFDAATADALRFRTEFGLRADFEFIAAVAVDPRAVMDFGVPLLPEEVREIERRSADADRIVPIVQTYVAGYPAEFGGLYIDQAHGGRVTVLFTDHLLEHETALRERLVGIGAVALRQVRYSEAVLRALQDRISTDSDWIATIPAVFQGVGVDTIGNRVEMNISSANGAADGLIRAYYGVEAAMINVISDGSGAALQPWGELHGQLVDIPAAVLRDLVILTELESGDVGVQCELGGDVGLGPDANGRFTLPCQAGTWTVRAARNIEDIVAEGSVVMPPGGTADVVLRPIAP